MGFQSEQRPDPSFTNLVTDAFPDLDTLFSAGDDVRQLIAHPGWSHLMRLLGLRVAGLDAALDARLLDSRAHYARLTGERAGLRAAEHAAHAIVAVSDRELAKQQAKHEGAAEPVPIGVGR